MLDEHSTVLKWYILHTYSGYENKVKTTLEKLIENRGHIVTYDALCEAVWGDGYYGYENSLNVHIRHLREKIGENVGKPQYLITMRGIGYKLTEAR